MMPTFAAPNGAEAVRPNDERQEDDIVNSEDEFEPGSEVSE